MGWKVIGAAGASATAGGLGSKARGATPAGLVQSPGSAPLSSER